MCPSVILEGGENCGSYIPDNIECPGNKHGVTDSSGVFGDHLCGGLLGWGQLRGVFRLL